MSLCKRCNHSGLCIIRNELETSTIKEFPDGKTAVLDMEVAMVHCDHFTEVPMSYDDVSEPESYESTGDVFTDPVLSGQSLPDDVPAPEPVPIAREPEPAPQPPQLGHLPQADLPADLVPATEVSVPVGPASAPVMQTTRPENVLKQDSGPVTQLGSKRMKLKLGGM